MQLGLYLTGRSVKFDIYEVPKSELSLSFHFTYRKICVNIYFVSRGCYGPGFWKLFPYP